LASSTSSLSVFHFVFGLAVNIDGVEEIRQDGIVVVLQLGTLTTHSCDDKAD